MELLLDELHRAEVDRTAEAWAARAGMRSLLNALDRAEVGLEVANRIKRVAERADVHFR